MGTASSGVLSDAGSGTQVVASRFLLLFLFLALGLATTQSHDRKLTATDAAAASVAAIVAVWGALHMLRAGRLPRPLFFLFIYAIVAVFNLPISIKQGANALEAVRRLFVIVVFCTTAIATFFATNGHPGRIKLSYVVLILVCGIIAGYNILALRSVADFSINAIRSAEAQPLWYLSAIAMSSGMLVSLVFPFLLAGGISWWSRVLSLVAFSIGILCLILSFSRTFWGVMPMVLAVTVAIGSHFGVFQMSLRAYLTIAASFVLVALIAWLALPQFTRHRLQIARGIEKRLEFHDKSGAQRAAEAKAILKWMSQQPTDFVTGWGVGNEYKMVSVNESAVGGLGTIKRDFSHDYWLFILLQTGAVGLATVCAFLWNIFGMLFCTLRIESVEGAGMTSALIMGLLSAFVLIIGISFTYQPFGLLLWNMVIAVEAGLACSVARSLPSHRCFYNKSSRNGNW